MAKGKYSEWLEEENLIKIAGWARNGLTEEDIAHNIGISWKTLNEWKKRFVQIRDALKKNKEAADLIIENALFIRAQGQYVTVKKPIKVKHITYDQNTGRKVSEEEEIQEAEELIYIPPDTTAQIFWLKNRRPQQWRAKPEVETEESDQEEAGVIEIPQIMQLEEPEDE